MQIYPTLSRIFVQLQICTFIHSGILGACTTSQVIHSQNICWQIQMYWPHGMYFATANFTAPLLSRWLVLSCLVTGQPLLKAWMAIQILMCFLDGKLTSLASQIFILTIIVKINGDMNGFLGRNPGSHRLENVCYLVLHGNWLRKFSTGRYFNNYVVSMNPDCHIQT